MVLLQGAAGVLISGTGPAAAVLELFNARAEVARLGSELVRRAADGRDGLSRLSRTERLSAALAVIAVSSYFDVLAAAELPFDGRELRLDRGEQVAVASGRPAASTSAEVVDALKDVSGLLPQAGDEQLGELRKYFQRVSTATARFVAGLAVWDRLTGADRTAFDAVLATAPDLACQRYEEGCRQLAMDFPEVALWFSELRHRATHAEVRQLRGTMDGLGRLLRESSAAPHAQPVPEALARAARAALEQPLAGATDGPAGLHLPTLQEAYLPPLCRIATAGPGSPVSEENWWAGAVQRRDLVSFLAAHLTAPQATRVPLLVLGQPGSGKSVLTTTLAAQLPATDFLPVRVVLRDVAVTADVQDQIEHAVRAATGEELTWPTVARAAGGALPVVLLDGFDELLQATGVSQSDYLVKVATFQRREYNQGRPVAVLVTSRMSVADRVSVPEGTVVVRLEPFDEQRIDTWLGVWNRTNEQYFAACGLAPLPAAAVLPHRELAGQPLLLLMLALYDAADNALQRHGGTLARSELYERLLRSFARREVAKQHPEFTGPDLDRGVETELLRLSLVAFAMFNRNSQSISAADLGADLRAMPVEPEPPRGPAQLRTPLGPAEIALGRFFFIHRSRARGDEGTLETFEFLHATFGEYLVPRLALLLLADLAARDALSARVVAGTRIDDDQLHALLSYAVLSVRAPILGFLRSLVAGVSAHERAAMSGVARRLFRICQQPRTSTAFADYQPRQQSVPSRHAAYSANLLLLTAITADTPVQLRHLYGDDANAMDAWRAQTTLWRSQLFAEALTGLVNALTLRRLRTDGHRDIAITFDPGGPTPPVDLLWTYDVENEPDLEPFIPAIESEIAYLTRRAHFMCRIAEDVVHHTLEPVQANLSTAMSTFVRNESGRLQSLAAALLHALLATSRPVEERTRLYRRAAHALAAQPPRDPATFGRYAGLLLDRIACDDELPAGTAATLATAVVEPADRPGPHTGQLDAAMLRCVRTFLGRDRAADPELVALAAVALADDPRRLPDPGLAVEVWARLAELGFPVPVPPIPADDIRVLFDNAVRHRPGLGHAIADLLTRLLPSGTER